MPPYAESLVPPDDTSCSLKVLLLGGVPPFPASLASPCQALGPHWESDVGHLGSCPYLL